MANCSICQRPLDERDDPYSDDCGGDCLMCMADAGDPTCVDAVNQLADSGIVDKETGFGRDNKRKEFKL